MVTIGALTAAGDSAPQFRFHIGAALRVGLDAAQVVEALIQLVPFVGLPIEVEPGGDRMDGARANRGRPTASTVSR
ncbi:carboxymuconolactone decarboxylase family protein [Streptomyces sp. NPDC002838]|uniref:carboxymuconolactone decarboxylase family protein n=1 Tax=Streptomyces sp. NPDC002838 TaxID=3154436 RepID=UPI003331C087